MSSARCESGLDRGFEQHAGVQETGRKSVILGPALALGDHTAFFALFFRCPSLALRARWGLADGAGGGGDGRASDGGGARGGASASCGLAGGVDAAGSRPIDRRADRTQDELATREFQKAKGLAVTGTLDEPTADALGLDPDGVFVRYRIHPLDLEEIGPCRQAGFAKSKLKHLGHEAWRTSLPRVPLLHGVAGDAESAEARQLAGPGDDVVVPAVLEPAPQPKASRLEVNLAEKTIRVIGPRTRSWVCFTLGGQGPGEAARPRCGSPLRDAGPWYTFNPEMWPEVKERITGTLKSRTDRGTRSGAAGSSSACPAMACTGRPTGADRENGSHGCFRLTIGRPALRYAVQSGTPVEVCRPAGGAGGESEAVRAGCPARVTPRRRKRGGGASRGGGMERWRDGAMERKTVPGSLHLSHPLSHTPFCVLSMSEW